MLYSSLLSDERSLRKFGLSDTAMATAAVALSCLTWRNCSVDAVIGGASSNETNSVRYNGRPDVNASASADTRFGDAADSIVPVGIFDTNGIAVSIYGYTFVIIILSIAVLFAILFTMCRLFIKAEAHMKATDHVENDIMFGNSQEDLA